MTRFFVAGLTATLVVLYPLLALTNSTGALPAHTGAPGEATCSTTNCHTDASGEMGNLNNGPGALTIEAPTAYQPGEMITFTIRLAQPGITRFGFQATVKDANGGHVGTLDLVDGTATRFVGTGNSYVTHRSSGTFQTDVATWSMHWIAPVADAGPVTIYAAGNATNTSGDRSGDLIYTESHTLTSDTQSGTADVPYPAPLALHGAYPNPFRSYTVVAYTLGTTGPVTLSLYDLRGRRVRALDLGIQPAGEREVVLDAQGLGAGVYLCELRTPTARLVQPLVLTP